MNISFFTRSIPTLGLVMTSIGAAFATPAPALAEQESAQATPEATDMTDVDPALWIVQDEDTTIYLFGTLHLLRPKLSWFDEAVRDAFDASDELVLEMIEPDPAKMQEIITSRAIDFNNPLRGKLDETEKATFDRAMTAIGMPVAAFDRMEPWFAAINLGVLPLVQAGYDLNSGVEKVLITQAKADGKTLVELESAEQQIGFLDNLPEKTQINYLISTAAGVDSVAEQSDAMITSWGDADIDALAAIMHAGFADPLLYDTMLTNRNIDWAGWIKTRLDTPGTVFIAVGAGHLAGDKSVQQQLARLNITTRRVEY
ncbi:MAG: TraB/GumN family protein [Pseudomonadota bacterium]